MEGVEVSLRGSYVLRAGLVRPKGKKSISHSLNLVDCAMEARGYRDARMMSTLTIGAVGIHVRPSANDVGLDAVTARTAGAARTHERWMDGGFRNIEYTPST